MVTLGTHSFLNFNSAVSKLNKLKNGNIFFVEIGAMDGVSYDELNQHIVENEWSGVLVEPIHDMFLKLKKNYSNKKKLFFENSAISINTGEDYIYRYTDEQISKNSLPIWLEGCTTFVPQNHLEVSSEQMIREKVQTICFKDLMLKYNISHIDILQIDTEGYDYIVFNEVINNIMPIIMKIEVRHISVLMFDKLKRTLQDKGYFFEMDCFDLIAIHRNFKSLLT